MSSTHPPVTVAQWLEQVNGDPYIPKEVKNGEEGQLMLTDTTFKSGSLFNSTQFLHLRTIWYPCARLGDLGNMMKNDPKLKWAGLVSDENIHKAGVLFNEKSPLWRQYLNEVRDRDIEDNRILDTLSSSPLSAAAAPQKPMRPSLDCGHLWTALYDQTLVKLNTSDGTPTNEEVEREYIIPKARNSHADAILRLAVDQPIPPFTPTTATMAKRQNQYVSTNPTQGTPEVLSYQPSRGGRFNQPAADEEFVNTALLSFLKTITGLLGEEFDTLNWMPARLPLRLAESVTTITPDTGGARTESRVLMEARVDGYLCRGASPFERKINKIPLALIEVKPFTLTSTCTSIRRQVGAEMASWISQTGDSTTGLLQSSASGRKRRLMINQYRDEIYIIVGEYGASFEEYIRPARSVVDGPAKAGSKSRNPPATRPIAGRLTQEDQSSGTSAPKPPSRPASLLAGSPAYIRLVENTSMEVSGDAGAIRRNPQPTQYATGTRRSARTGNRWAPDESDFLIMHEFGPFRTDDPDHMDLLIRRYIALMLELRGPQAGLSSDVVSTESSDQPGSDQSSASDEASSSGAT